MPLTKTGNFTTPTTTGNFDVTGLGFQPTGIILYHESGPDTVALVSHIGFADAAGNQVSNFTIATLRDAANAARRSTSNKVLSRSSASGVVQSEATVTMLADGFRLNFTTATNALQFRYVAFKDVPIKVGMITASTATTASGSVTGMSFKPAAMMGIWMAGSGTASSAAGHGFVDSALNQYSSVGNNNSGTGSLYASEQNFVTVYSPTGYAGKMNVTAMNSNGFSYTTGATGSAFDYGYFAIGGVQSKLVDVTAPATGSNAYTGVGFKPQTVLNKAMYISGTGAAYTNSWGLADTFGVVDDTLTQGYFATVGMNGSANTRVRYFSTANGFGRTLFGTPSATPIIEGNLTSFDPDGFTINWTNIEASVLPWKTLALAVEPTTQSTTQTGNARIEKAFTVDQTGNARIERANTVTQTGNARIERTFSINQIGNATIESPFVQNTITQVGNARISKTNTLTQTGNARISKTNTIDQVGNAFISLQRALDQVGNARIEKINTITQTGNANISRQNTIDQIGNATIVRINQISIIGNATISNPYPDKRPQTWTDSDNKQPNTWSSDDKKLQKWSDSSSREATSWENSGDKQNQEWTDSNDKRQTHWRRQYYE